MCAQITLLPRDPPICMTPHIRTGCCCWTWGTTQRSVTVEKGAPKLRNVIYWKGNGGSRCCERLHRRWGGKEVQTTVTYSDVATLEENLVCVSLLAMHLVASCIPCDLSHLHYVRRWTDCRKRKETRFSSLYYWQPYRSSPLIWIHFGLPRWPMVNIM